MERYPVIALVRALLAFGGWAAVAIAAILVVLGIGELAQPNNPFAVTGFLKMISGGLLAVSGLMAVAIGEAISVIVNIEVNTRGFHPIAQRVLAAPVTAPAPAPESANARAGSGEASSWADEALLKSFSDAGYVAETSGNAIKVRRASGGVYSFIYSRGEASSYLQRTTATLTGAEAQRWRAALDGCEDRSSIMINGVLVWKLGSPEGRPSYLVNQREYSDADEVLRACGVT
jgi:hypothetical protein